MNRDIVETLARALLKVGGGFLVAKGITDDATATELIGALVTVAGVVWGIVSAKAAPKSQDVPIQTK